MLKNKVALLGLILLSNNSSATLDSGIQHFKSKNYAEAYNDLITNTETNEPRAMYFLGVIYDQGLYVDKNEEKAIALFKNSSRLGNLSSTFYLAEKSESTGFFDNIPDLEKNAALLKNRLEPRGRLWDLPKIHSDTGLPVKDDLLEEYLNTEKAIVKERNRSISAEYIGNFQWKADDAIITIILNKKKNPKYSFFDAFRSPLYTPYNITSDWSYQIPVRPLQLNSLVRTGLSFSGSAIECDSFSQERDSDDRYFDLTSFFRECMGTISARIGENDSKPIINFTFSRDKLFVKDYKDAVDEVNYASVLTKRIHIGFLLIIISIFAYLIISRIAKNK